MGILRICDDSPYFADGDPLSPTALNLIGDTLRALDEGTRLGGVAFTGGYGQYPEETDEPAQIIYRGGGIFVSGMTTLRIVTTTTGTVIAGDTLRVYFGDADTDGTLPGTYTDRTLAAGQQTHTIPLSGYAAGDAIRVHLEVRHAADPNPPYTGCRVEVTLAELLPVALIDAAPTLPTFTTAADITGAKLTQLADFVDWLVRRAATRYDPLFILQIRRFGPFCIPDYGSQQTVVWRGGLRRTPLHAALRARGKTLRVWGGATEQIRLWVNGSIVSVHNVPASVGESAWELVADLSALASDSVVGIKLDYVRTAPIADDMPINRWTIDQVVVDAPSGGVASLTTWQIRQASVSEAALVAWLQAARTLAQAIADRISANGGFWGNQRLFTARPAFDAGRETSQFTLFEPWSVPATWHRAGEALVGRGRALSLGYAAGWFDEAEYKRVAATDEGVGAYPLKNARTHPVVDGDSVETFQLYLDSVPGLPVGAPYNVRGVESYVLMEHLKVVES